MEQISFAYHSDRGILTVSGKDSRSFLQGVITNDIDKARNQAIYACFLTPQGKFLHEFFIFSYKGKFFVETELDRLDELKNRLRLYKLRSDVVIENESESWDILTIHEEISSSTLLNRFPLNENGLMVQDDIILYPDPRLASMGVRGIEKKKQAIAFEGCVMQKEKNTDNYHCKRYSLGIAEGSRDLRIEKSILLEFGFDFLNAIDWNKGCYLGQELTARTKYRGIIRKHIMPFYTNEKLGEKISVDDEVFFQGNKIGKICSVFENLGLAMIRQEYIENIDDDALIFECRDMSLICRKPLWWLKK